MEIKQGFSLNDLIELSKKNTKYKKLFTGLAMIDKTTQDIIKDTVANSVNNVDEYYIKTELSNHCYSVYIYNTDSNATVGYSWLLSEFLNMCSSKTIESNIQDKVKKILKEFNKKNISTTKINWVY